MNGKRYDQLSYPESQHMTRGYVCAQCWGELVSDFDPGKAKDQRYKVICPDCGEDRGFVTREYAEQRVAESGAEKSLAMHNLGELLGIERKPFDQETAIKQLWPE